MQRTVVVLTPASQRDPRHQQSGWTEWLTQGVVQTIRNRDFHALTINPTTVEADQLAQLVEDRPMGVVVPEVFRGTDVDTDAALPFLELLTKAGVPVTAYGGDPRLAAFDRVTSGHDAGAYALTRWLIGLGRRRPVLVLADPLDVYWKQDRRTGYERAMREAGLKPRYMMLQGMPKERTPSAQHFEMVTRYLAGYLLDHLVGDDPADALLAMSDGEVFTLARACKLHGKRVHEDVAIVGYDNYWLDSWEREYDPIEPLATVDKQNFEMGKALVDLLIDRIEGRLPDAPQTRVVEAKLVTGQDALSSLSATD